jgi:hypothetical protein
LTIAESKGGFYIVDDPSRPIRLFDKTGKFVGTRGSIGRGPNEILSVMRIAADYDAEKVYALSRTGTTLIALDADGRMIARNDSVGAAYISRFGDRLLLFNSDAGYKTLPTVGESVDYLNVFSSDLRHESTVTVPWDGSNMITVRTEEGSIVGMRFGGFVSNNGERLLVKRGRNDTVYLYKNQPALEPEYRLEMGRYSPPAEFIDAADTYMTPAPIEEWQKYYAVGQMYEADKYIVANLHNGLGSDGYVVFDRATAVGGGFSTEGPDGAPGLFIDGVKFAPMFVRDNRLVGYVNALDLVDGAESITRPDLKELAASLKEESNPVIVVVTLKK